MICCIYEIINLGNNKFYVGRTIDFKRRQSEHIRDLKKQRHHSDYLQRAWNKYGEENFSFEVIEEVLDKSKLIEREQHYLDTLKPEYNICKDAKGGLIEFSSNSKNKISYSLKERFKNKENHPMYGKIRPEETKQKIRKNLMGFKHSKESKNRMSLSRKGIKRPKHSIRMKGQGNSMYGKKNPGASKFWLEYWRKKRETHGSVE